MSDPSHQPSLGKEAGAPARPSSRWWSAGLILLLSGAAVLYVRVISGASHQLQNIRTLAIAVVTFAVMLFWLLLVSPLKRTVRRAVFAAAVGVVGLLAALFEIHGVTGDFAPILRFRWSQPALPSAASSPASHPAIEITGSYPQFLGPRRDATLPDGPRLARDWKTRPPEPLWRQPIGAAWSGFAVMGNRAVTLEQRGSKEWVVCYDVLTGRVYWTHADEARYSTTIAGEGPRTTPAIAGEKVVTLGGTGVLNCLDLATGKVLWSKDIITENQSQVPDWGVAGSPLILDDRVIVNPGGGNGRSLVAYRLGDGEFVWGGGGDSASYSSPCVGTIAAVPQILMFNQHAVFAHEPGTGRVLWQHPWGAGQPHVALPMVIGEDRVLVSSGYGVGSELLRIQRDANGGLRATRLWKTIRLKSKFNNMIARDGHVYGLDDGILACIELETGEQKWKDGRYGHGQFLLVRDVLLITAENGDVVLVDPAPAEHRELTRFRALKGKTWNPPALIGDLLLVRNDREAACYRLPVE